MKKDTLVYIAIGGGLILLFLLWRNRNPDNSLNVMNAPANPNTGKIIQVPVIQQNNKSDCGCNPMASNILSGAADKIKIAESNFEQQLKAYTESINAYFATQTFQ